MAYVPTDPNLLDDEERRKREEEQQINAGTSAPGDTGEGAVDAGPGGDTAAGAQGNFTPINAYLDANRAQAADLSGKIAGKLTEEEQKVRGEIGQAGEEAQGQIAGSRVTADEGLVNRALENPTEFVKSQADLDAFKKQRDANYTGPTGLAETRTADLQAKVREAQRRAGLVDSEQGRSELLRTYGTNPTEGQIMLDQLLLGADPNSRQTLTAAANPFQSLDEYLDQVTGEVKTAGESAATDTAAARNLVSGRLTSESGAIPTAQKEFQDRLSSTSQKSVDYNNRLNSILAKLADGRQRELTAEERNLIGFNQDILPLIEQYPSIFATQAKNNPLSQLSTYYTQGDQAALPTASDVVSAEDLARYQALAQLAGMPIEGIPTASTADSFRQFSGAQPSFNNMGPLNEIQMSYGNMYQQLLDAGQAPANVIDYMNKLYSVMGEPQPTAQPTTPMPEPGTNGDLGAGFHWDETLGAWVPNIPLQPNSPPPSGGGGSRFYSMGVA